MELGRVRIVDIAQALGSWWASSWAGRPTMQPMHKPKNLWPRGWWGGILRSGGNTNKKQKLPHGRACSSL